MTHTAFLHPRNAGAGSSAARPAAKARGKFCSPKIQRNPLKSHDSDEKFQEIPRNLNLFHGVSQHGYRDPPSFSKFGFWRRPAHPDDRSPPAHPWKARHRLEVVEVHCAADILAGGFVLRPFAGTLGPFRDGLIVG